MTSVESDSRRFQTIVYTGFALVAFAANSVFCRLALGTGAIDAASFSTIRLISGAVTLWMLTSSIRKKHSIDNRGTWTSASMLFLYAVTFSFAYVSLSAGTGALILFGSVQATMFLAGFLTGERLHLLQWAGLLLALAGLVYLVFPGLTAPSPEGSVLMAVAGIAWGVYSLRGRGAVDSIAVTAYNFARSVPLVVGISIIMMMNIHVSPKGIGLAVVSGSLTSGIGYVLWYMALRGLTKTQGAIVQLPVPLLAAVGGVMFLSEAISIRLVVSSIATLGGVGLAVIGHEHSVRGKEAEFS